MKSLQTGGLIDRHTDGRTDKHTDGPKDWSWQTGRQTDGQTDTGSEKITWTFGSGEL